MQTHFLIIFHSQSPLNIYVYIILYNLRLFVIFVDKFCDNRFPGNNIGFKEWNNNNSHWSTTMVVKQNDPVNNA